MFFQRANNKSMPIYINREVFYNNKKQKQHPMKETTATLPPQETQQQRTLEATANNCHPACYKGQAK